AGVDEMSVLDSDLVGRLVVVRRGSGARDDAGVGRRIRTHPEGHGIRIRIEVRFHVAGDAAGESQAEWTVLLAAVAVFGVAACAGPPVARAASADGHRPLIWPEVVPRLLVRRAAAVVIELGVVLAVTVVALIDAGGVGVGPDRVRRHA